MPAAYTVSVHSLPHPLPGYAPLTYPRWRHWLTPSPSPDAAPEAPPQPPLRAICATTAQGDPIGLALLYLPEDAAARLLSVMVAPAWRRRGLGSALLAAVTAEAAEAGASALTAQHNTQAAGVHVYDAFMAANGWPPAETLVVRGFGRAGWARRAGETFSRHRAALVRRGYALSPWPDLTEDDLAAIRALVASGVVPDGFDPFDHHAHDAPDLSAVLRRHGAVVGWAKAHWQNAEQTQAFYHSGWVLPAVARQGWLAMAMIDLSARQADLYGDDSLTGFATAADNLPMQGILFNRFGALAERIDRLMQRSLPLSPTAPAPAGASPPMVV